MDNFSLNTHHAYLNNDIIFKSNGSVSIVDKVTGKEYHFTDELKTRLCAGRHVFACGNQEEEVYIEDAIKLGGGRIKGAFVFDDNPWIFVTTKDRLYITNKETKEEKLEYSITPDSIKDLGKQYAFEHFQYFLFQTKNDYAVYDVLYGKIIYSFDNHIYSNYRLVIYKKENGIEVYDFRQKKVVVYFEGQYSFGNKFYFVKERKLYGLNTSSSFINVIDFVEEIGEEDLLLGNYLLKLEKDYSEKKEYSYFGLGNGENNMNKTKLIFPYYIENWKGEDTKSFQRTRDSYNKFKEENKGLLSDNSNIKSMCIGVRINRSLYEWENHSHMITLYGEIVAYPALTHAIPFKLKGIEGEALDFSDATIEPATPCPDDGGTEMEYGEPECELNKGEILLGKSLSGNLLITKEDNNLYLRNIKDKSRNEILNNSFDSSNYTNAYFTSDGKSIVVQLNNNEGKILGFEDLNMIHFDVDGFTVSRNEGFNSNNFINHKSAKALIIEHNSLIEVAKKPNDNGHRFFTCGKNPDGTPRIGYIPENAAQRWFVPEATLDEFQYVEIVRDKNGVPFKDAQGNPRPMPCLMLVGNSDTSSMNFTVAGNEGFNGYKPEITILDGRKPVWRDPISLAIISEKDMSKHIFMSPDGKYSADINMKTVYYDRLEEKEITFDELCLKKAHYDWNTYASDQEKKDKIESRKELLKNYDKDLLFKHILSYGWGNRETENLINYYLEGSETFTPLFIDRLGYVCYRKNQGDECRILIGRSVWFLNYVSFSYDSRYLAFGAKMNEDEFRHSKEGVFVLFDLERRKEVIRQENEILLDSQFQHSIELEAIWMTMFNKTGDVAYYDSHPNAYLVTAKSNYKETKKAEGKSLLCFSPTGKYIALSDQSYIDYAHHPELKWGHQPSGNVYIHSTNCFEQCLEHYNDLGDGIEGVACQAGSVSSAAFSQDERRLLVVGNDGVVVVRNLRFAGKEE